MYYQKSFRIYLQQILIFALLLFFVIPPICEAQREEIEQDHIKFYQSGSELDVSEVLGLSSMEKGTIMEVKIRYNMIRSYLEADWLYNEQVIGHSSMPKGLKKYIRFTYNRFLPGTISVRFTGPKGQIQVTRVSALVDKMGEKEEAVQYGENEVDKQKKYKLLSKLIKINPATKRKDYELASKVKKQLIIKIIERNLIDEKTIRSNISEKNAINILADRNTITMSGQIKSNQDGEIVTKNLKEAAGELVEVKYIKTKIHIFVPPVYTLLPIVPNVIGNSQTEAEEIIAKLGFVNDVTLFTSYKKEYQGQEGKVVSQSPKAGTQIPKGSEVNITVYKFEAPKLPDFKIEQVTISPSNPKAGDKVKVTAVIYNGGQAVAPSSTTSLWQNERILLENFGTSQLNVNERYTINFKIERNLTPGEHTFKVKADDRNKIVESDEMNNFSQIKLTVPQPEPEVDMEIVGVTLVINGPVQIGDHPQYKVIVRNNCFIIGGDNASYGSFTLMGKSDDGQQLELPTTMNTREKEILFAFPDPFKQEKFYKLTFIIDAGDNVDEKDESNNQFSYTQRVIKNRPFPDIVVEEVYLTPAKPKLYDQVQIGFKIKNIGDQRMPINCVTIKAGGNPFWNHCANTDLSPGESKTITIEDRFWIATPGAKAVVVTADSYRRVWEKNESNNSKGKAISISIPENYSPELYIDRYRITTEWIEVGDRPQFEIYIENPLYLIGSNNPTLRNVCLKGTTDSGDQYQLYFDMDALEKKVNFTFLHPFMQEPYDRITWQVDCENKVDELNENNNTFIINQQITSPKNRSDLVVEEIILSPSNPNPNDQVIFYARIKNIGNVPAPITCLKFKAKNYDWNHCVNTRLAVEEEKVIGLDERHWIATPGRQSISALIDPGNVVSEKNERNNTLVKTVDIDTPPANAVDLYISRIKVLGTPVKVGTKPQLRIFVERSNYIYGENNPPIPQVKLRLTSKIGHYHYESFSINAHQKIIEATLEQPFEESGYFDLEAQIDIDGEVSEFNENNNIFIGWIQIVP